MTGDADAARAFAAEHAHYTEDLAMWTAAATASGGPVLDLGSASGRVALALARAGVEVWALDADPHMLTELAQAAAAEGAGVAARVRTVPGDMRAFSLEGRFPLALATMNTLQVLLDPADHAACLACVRRHLTGDGEFWFDVTLPDIADVVDQMGLVRAGHEHVDEATGERWIHSSWYEAYDAATQTASYALRVDHVAADGTSRPRVRRHDVHLFAPAELTHLLARSGLRVLQAWGGFAGEPLEDGAAHQVYRCGVAP